MQSADFWWRIVAVSALGLLLVTRLAHAHDGYEMLERPGGGSCCGGQDCGPTQTRERDGRLEALTNTGRWVVIPPEVMLPAELNPVAGPSLCWSPPTIYLPEGLVRCFIPGRAT